MNISDRIQYDMNFIQENIVAGEKRPAVIDGLKNAVWSRENLNRQGSIAWHNTRHAFYRDVVMNSPHSVFVTLHGTPITAQELKHDGVEPIFQVPQNCMIVMIAPPGTVVFGGDAEDMCSYRYEKTKLFMGAGAGLFPGGCEGADGYRASLELSPQVVDAYGSADDVDEENPDTIAGRVSQRHEKIAAKLEEKEQKAAEKKARKQGVCTEDTINELLKEIRVDPSSPYGHEILENMQIFFPGDWVYNQYQEWEQDATNSGFEAGPNGARYDANFDIFKLGTRVDTYSRTFTGGGIDTANLDDSANFPPPGVDLTHLKGKIIPPNKAVPIGLNVPDGQGGEVFGCQPYSGKTPNMVHPLSITLKATIGPDMKITTRELIQRLCGDGTGPKMIVLNSCSPYRPSNVRHKGKLPKNRPGIANRNSISNAANLLLRNYCFDFGRGNFCSMRKWAIDFAKQNGLTLPVVPQYDEHRGITVAFTDDREDFYKTLGNFLKIIKESRDLNKAFTPSMFKTFLDLCDKSDKSGKQLATFKRLYNNFLSKLPPYNLTKSAFFMLPFDQELYLIELKKNGVHDSYITTERAKLFTNMKGGKRKRRRRKKKTKRKRKKKTKKSRRRRKKRTRRRKK